ncbi:MAG: ffh [Bacilli bacterium]|nr:ffh [Bacilli bacterium]
MFEGLAGRLQDTLSKLRGRGKLSEADVNEAMKEIRRHLIEADVNFKVAKDFIEKVRVRAVGSEVLTSLTPGQQVVKIVDEELTQLLGGAQSRLEQSPQAPTVVLMVGLQGAGKTTHAAKLAMHLQKQGKYPLLVACDIYRPAAIEQLRVLAETTRSAFFSLGDQVSPVKIAAEALAHAKTHGYDYVIVDTAGRLHIDEALMGELQDIRSTVHPTETLLVVDAATGQDAVTVAESFHRQLELTGLILSRMDGDTRGGAALSIRAVTGCPVKFIGTGEKVDQLEPFYPDRLASRILGMGDVLTLIEKAQSVFDQDQAKVLEKKMMAGDFTLDLFLDQLQQVRNLGPLDQLMGLLPGMGKMKKQLSGANIDDKQINRVEAIIRSMTPKERNNYKLMDYNRKMRIAKGSGTSIQEVNRLLRQFEEMLKMMKQFSGMSQKMMKKGKKGKKAPFMPFR